MTNTYAPTCVERCETVSLIVQNMFASYLYRHLFYVWEGFRSTNDVTITLYFHYHRVAIVIAVKGVLKITCVIFFHRKR